MKYRYIAIEREYGSGGTAIAQRLSEELCVPLYGRRILELVAEEMQMNVDEIEEFEEKASSNFVHDVVTMNIQGIKEPAGPGGRNVYPDECKIIRELADTGPSIFVGHCAAKALEDREGVLRIFFFADVGAKNKRIREEYHIAPGDIEATRNRFDKKRSSYYTANTGKAWDDPRNYDLIINTGKLSTEECVRTICAAIGL